MDVRSDEPALVDHELTVVAFLRGVGGQVRVLLAVDRVGVQLHDGEPAILVEHRPGASPAELGVECASAVTPGAEQWVRAVADELTSLIDGAFDAEGAFDGGRMLGHPVRVSAPVDAFASEE